MQESITETRFAAAAIPCPPILRRGDRVRVTHLADMHNFDGGPVDYPAGDVIDGTIDYVDASGFFSLIAEYGEIRGYSSLDSTLRIEVLAPRS